ncbi:MAG: SPOR domain-containing protein [Moraxella sp.]|uniref:LysM peptidoglycan-binding domain-containing protein n=1 Tax=Moraxella sp. TaxID=479 RepID=UPI0026DB464B|nr:LysM peptidoglycan-binding domain-containing protein [Moraxella sp.]MDO4450465.1 SPOR domain-containing protein [Moraxella sp.]
MISKQLLLGLSLALGGGVVFYAINQGQPDPSHQMTTSATTPSPVSDDVARPVAEPLTIGREEEDRLLAIKQKQRETQTLAQEKEVRALLDKQEKAQNLALAKADAEQKMLEQASNLTVETRPESIAKAKEEQIKADREKRLKAEKAKAEKQKTEKQKTQNKAGEHKVVRGDGLIKLSRQYGVPVSAIAEANNMGRNDPLPLGKTIKIPSKSQVARLEREAKEREAKAKTKTKEIQEVKAKETKTKDTKSKEKDTKKATVEKRPSESRQKENSTDGKARYSVQVSLADNQAKADELAKKYRAAGYKVTTSQTSRGVRVLVGSEKNQQSAETLRDKIRKDSRVDGSGAWVKRTQ